MNPPWSPNATAISRSVFSGCLLATWMLALLYLAFIAWSNRASETLLSFLNAPSEAYASMPDNWSPESPIDHLRAYSMNQASPAPLDSLLRQILNNPDWTERVIKREGSGDDPDWNGEQYKRLFNYLENRLRSLVKNPTMDLSTPKYFSIPDAFLLSSESSGVEVRLDPETIRWVEEQRALDALAQRQKRIFDTFLLLIVLGGLGSLIYLMREYMDPNVYTPLSAFLFRPVLGMLLAVAVFVLTALTHSIVSNADMFQMRKEPLYVLAFAAGLLSEQTYEIILMRAKTSLSKAKSEFSKAESDTKDS